MMKEEYYYWPADLLARYVVKAHHREIRRRLPEIKAGFVQLVAIYGDHNPELRQAHTLFLQCAAEMEAHFSKEGTIVLMYARRYQKELMKPKELRKPGLYSVCPSIHKMYLEHKMERLCFDWLFGLLRQVTIPAKESYLYETTYQQLYELRGQWRAQVQLENDVLFPKIIEMEAILDPL